MHCVELQPPGPEAAWQSAPKVASFQNCFQELKHRHITLECHLPMERVLGYLLATGALQACLCSISVCLRICLRKSYASIYLVVVVCAHYSTCTVACQLAQSETNDWPMLCSNNTDSWAEELMSQHSRKTNDDCSRDSHCIRHLYCTPVFEMWKWNQGDEI